MIFLTKHKKWQADPGNKAVQLTAPAKKVSGFTKTWFHVSDNYMLIFLSAPALVLIL